MPVTTVQRRRSATVPKVTQRLHVGICEILDVDVVADARAVGCRIVRAEDTDLVALTDGCLAGDLRQ